MIKVYIDSGIIDKALENNNGVVTVKDEASYNILMKILTEYKGGYRYINDETLDEQQEENGESVEDDTSENDCAEQ